MFNSKYSSIEQDKIFSEVPELMVGFDTETTGLWKPPLRCPCPEHSQNGGLAVSLCPNDTPQLRELRKNDESLHEPITYGLVVYKNGKPFGRPSEWVAAPSSAALTAMSTVYPDKPLQKQPAIATHGWTPDMVTGSYSGRTVDIRSIDGNKRVVHTLHQPAVSRVAGVTRAAQELGEWQRRGAVIVGANVRGFDLAMLKHHYENLTKEPLFTSGLDLDTAPILDVTRHHWAMAGRPMYQTGSRAGQPQYRALSSSKLYKQTKDTLSDIYDVPEGNHSASEDARASVEVALRQIAANRGEFTPRPIRLG